MAAGGVEGTRRVGGQRALTAGRVVEARRVVAQRRRSDRGVFRSCHRLVP